ncbi:MAG TPA: response regulator [Bacteroidales bacterium]|nr:response regulator [Bacteroidales bacterium]HRZ20308.1 response regulator [Bacteroidales bacterium]
MNEHPTILVIDDEAQIIRLLEITLRSADYRVSEASTGRDGMMQAAMHPPDLILLDLGLPDEDGQNILVKLREWFLSPIIILSVRDSEDEIIRALDNGANDYLVKPFRTGELLARIRTVLRNNNKSENKTIISSKDLSIDLANRMVKKGNVIIKLTSTEYSLLALLAKNENRVLTHQFILMKIWGPGYVEQSQYLRVFIAQLRKKIEDNPNHPVIIVTEPVIGYRFMGDD